MTDPLGLLTCSGSHDVLSWLGDAACNVGNFGGNVAGGVWSGVVDTAQGLGSLGHGVWNSSVAWVYDPRAAEAQWQANVTLGSYIVHHPLETGQSIIIAVAAPCGTAIRSGNVGRAIGRCGFDLIMLVGGTKGLTKIGVLGKLRTAADVSAASRELRIIEFADKAAARQAFSGSVHAAANRFFREAAKNSVGFTAIAIRGERFVFRFFSPARNPGYGKIYVQVVDSEGRVLLEYKDTIGPEGLLERKYVHG